MYVVMIKLDIHILTHPGSLKEKRMTVNRFKDKIWNKFKVSIAEVGSQDLWQRCELGISFVTSDSKSADAWREHIENFVMNFNEIEILQQNYEIINYNHPV